MDFGQVYCYVFMSQRNMINQFPCVETKQMEIIHYEKKVMRNIKLYESVADPLFYPSGIYPSRIAPRRESRWGAKI